MKNEIDIQLLDAAKAMTGSDYATAKVIHVSRSRVSDWRKGREQMPAAEVVLVAQAAGLDPVDWCARAVIDKHEGTQKGEDLKDALKKALEVTGEEAALYGADTQPDSYLIRCINRTVMQLPERRKFRRLVRSPWGCPPSPRLPAYQRETAAAATGTP